LAAQAGKTAGDPAVGAALSKVVTIVPHLDVAGLERLAHASLQVPNRCLRLRAF
jgi:hypothetical protein